jgi:hypothetical protein
MNALSIIQLRAPQWATDSRINSFIEYARENTSSEVFGERTETAVALRVLHLLALEAMRGGNTGATSANNSGQGHAGQITSQSEGQLSMSFSSGSKASARYGNLSTTMYGQELIELIRGNVFAPVTRMSPYVENNVVVAGVQIL